MKRLSLLAVLALTLATTIGAVVADEAADTAAPVVAAALAESPATLPSLPVTAPEPLLKAACSASIICICGGYDIPLSCTGNVSCFSGTRHVTCDGVRENCPPISSCPH